MEQQHSRHNFKAFVWHASWLAFTITFTEVNTVLPGMILKVGGNQVHVGILTAIMVGVPMLAQLVFAGFLTPKPRKKPYLLLGIYLRIVTLSGMAWTLTRFTDLAFIWVILLVYGWMLIFTTSGAFASVSYADILGKSISSDSRKRFFVVRQFLSSLGVLASALIARQILRHFSYPLNYEILFAAAAVTLFLASWGFIAIRETPVANRFESSSLKEIFKFIPGYIRQDANLRNFILMNNLAGFTTTLMPFYVVLARDSYSLSADDIGNFLLIAIVGMILSNLLWSRILRRHAFKGVLYIWIVLGGVIPILALSLATFASYTAFQFVFFVSGAAMSAQRIAQEGILLEITENDNRALYSGINGAFNLSIAIFPLISGFAIAWLGYGPILILGSLAMFTSFFFARRIQCGIKPLAQ